MTKLTSSTLRPGCSQHDVLAGSTLAARPVVHTYSATLLPLLPPEHQQKSNEFSLINTNQRIKTRESFQKTADVVHHTQNHSMFHFGFYGTGQVTPGQSGRPIGQHMGRLKQAGCYCLATNITALTGLQAEHIKPQKRFHFCT